MSDILEKFNVFFKISEEFKLNIKLFHVFYGYNGKNVLFVTKEDKVFAFGSNYYGMLGFGHRQSVYTPTEIPELNGKQIKQFFIGEYFVLALNEENHVFGWGMNSCGQLGRGYTSGSKEYLKPEIIPELENIIEISCGEYHSLALNKENNVFSWGFNRWGQVGCGKQSTYYITRPVQLNELPKIKSIHCYHERSFAVTFDGLVYTWGWNRDYFLGHESTYFIFSPKLIIGLYNVISVGFLSKDIDINSDTTYFLTNEGNIYFCGKINSSEDSELDSDIEEINSREYQKIPKILETDLKFQSLETIGYYSEVLALSEETVYCLERNSYKKTKYKTIEEYCMSKREITLKTIEREYIKLGSGGFGTVYKYLDKNDKKEYALKLIKITDQGIDKIKEKIPLLSKCDPKFIIKYYDSWIIDNNFYIKIELCSTNLYKVIKEKTKIFRSSSKHEMSSIEYFISSQLMQELLECVQYLHELNPPIIHRDLKPQNILVNYQTINGRFLKLSDFEFATFGSENTKSHSVWTGLDSYMAPEITSGTDGRTKSNIKADIYSLGKIFCDLFGFDINDENQEIPKNDELLSYLTELEILIDQMMSTRYHRRPSCSKILEKSNSWLINANQVNDGLELVANQPESFIYIYLTYKLERKLVSDNQNNIQLNFKEFEKIGENLGSGGFGTVIKARNKIDQQLYAIKVIEMKIDENEDKNSINEYQREVQLISSCSEEYVVKCFNSWIENNKLFIQMELCSDNLKNILKEKNKYFGRKELEPMTTTEFFISSQMFKEILDSVHYLHNFEPGFSIIHRDLKPSNILVNFEPKNGRFLKLADFGTAAFCYKTFSKSKYEGTPIYSPPETISQAQNRPLYSVKTDIYSLGQILCQLFDYDINSDDQNIKQNADLEQHWSQLEQLINAMLTTRYRERPTCAEIIDKYNFWQMDKTQLTFQFHGKYKKFFETYLRTKLEQNILK